MSARSSIAALLAAAGLLALASGAAPTPAAAAETQFSCLPQGADGKPLRQPEIGFICGQVDALRADCEQMMTNGNLSGMSLHCFGWRPEDVRRSNKPARNRAQEQSR